MKKCMYCGNENEDANENCSKCGNRLLDITPQQVTPAEEVPEETTEEAAAEEQEIPEIQISEEDVETPLENVQPDLQDMMAQQQGYYGEQREWKPDVQQQYGGQAYGYQQQVQQYGTPEQAQAGYEYGRVQTGGGGSMQLMLKARKMVKSPLFFLLVLIYTVMTVSSAIHIVGGNAINSLNAVQATLQEVFGANVAISFLNGILDIAEKAAEGIIIIAGVIMHIPGVVICLGMWLAFFFTNRRNEPISTVGYTMTRVMVWLKFIVRCLILIAGLIISVAFVVAAGASASTASIVVGIALLAAVILISLFVILFYVQLLHALKAIKQNVKSGTDVGRIALFVPVVGIFMGIFTILGMLPMAPDDILGLVTHGTSAAWLIFGSLWLLVYRHKASR